MEEEEEKRKAEFEKSNNFSYQFSIRRETRRNDNKRIRHDQN